MSQNVDLDVTIAALQSDLKSIPSDEALDIINVWYLLFQDNTLGKDLQQVREAIEKGGRTGLSLSDTLTNLGAKTFEASNEVVDDETAAAKIQDIATLLSDAGNALNQAR
jgi:hypothetical protein